MTVLSYRITVYFPPFICFMISSVSAQLQPPLPLLPQVPAAEHPMHFAPFFFAFTIYATAASTAAAIISITIKSAMPAPLSSSH